MAVTAAELLVKVGWDDSEVDSGSKNTGDKMGKLGGILGGGAAAIGTAAVAIGGATVASMMKMEDAMTPIGTLVGTQSQQFKDLQAGIKDMVANSPDSPAELGESAYAILSAGISDTGTALKALNDATDLAGAGMGTTAQATDLITSAMNSFKGENLDSEQAAKLFYGTIASGKTTTAGLAQGFGAIAPLAASAGVSFKDLMAATAALTATGMPASQAYGGIKGALTGIIKPSGEAAEAAKALGLEFNQQHLAAVGLPAFLNEVKTATGGNIEKMAGLFGSVEGLNSVLALTGTQADAFASNLTNIGTAGENMAERAKETDQTMSARFATMKNKIMVTLSDLGNKGFKWLSDFWAEHGTAIMGVVNKIVDGIQLGFQTVVNWVRTNWPAIQEVIGQVFAVIGSAVTVIVGVFQDQLIPAFQAVFGFVMDHKEILVGIGVVVGVALVSAFLAWAASAAAAAIATIAAIAPVIAIGAAIAALVAGIIWAYNNWGWFHDAINAVRDFIVDKLVPAFQAIWSFIKDKVIPIVADAVGAYITFATGFYTTVWDAINKIIGVIQTVIDFVLEAPGKMVRGIAGAFVGMWDGIKDAFRGAINWVIDAWNNLSFKMPEVDTHIPGVGKVGGFGLDTPNISRLAFGGDITRAGMAIVGERGPETVWLDEGARVRPGVGGASGGITYITIQVPFGGSMGEEIVRELVKYNRVKGDIPIVVRG